MSFLSFERKKRDGRSRSEQLPFLTERLHRDFIPLKSYLVPQLCVPKTPSAFAIFFHDDLVCMVCIFVKPCAGHGALCGAQRGRQGRGATHHCVGEVSRGRRAGYSHWKHGHSAGQEVRCSAQISLVVSCTFLRAAPELKIGLYPRRCCRFLTLLLFVMACEDSSRPCKRRERWTQIPTGSFPRRSSTTW